MLMSAEHQDNLLCLTLVLTISFAPFLYFQFLDKEEAFDMLVSDHLYFRELQLGQGIFLHAESLGSSLTVVI